MRGADARRAAGFIPAVQTAGTSPAARWLFAPLKKWCGVAGLVVWLGATVALVVVMRRGIIAESVDLRLPDGTPIHGTLYRPRNDSPDLSGAVVVHGTALSHHSCAPGLAIPLAREGILTLAIDLRGHGHSGGALPRRELDAGTDAAVGPDDYPEIDAALDFLGRHPRFIGRHSWLPAQWLAVVGHSRGGLAAACAGCRRADVHAVVSIGVAPQTCDLARPHNFLILTGGADQLFPRAKCVEAIRRATGGAVQEPYQSFGDFYAGTARRLQLVGGTNHLTELADSGTTHHVVQWVASAVFVPYQPPSSAWLPGLVAAVLAASLGGLPACAWLLAGPTRAALGEPAATARPTRLLRLALLLGLVLAAVPAVAAVSGWLEVGPVYFAVPCAALLTTAAACGLGIGGAEWSPDWRRAARGLVLGLVALGITAVWLGVPWGRTWLELLPSGRRALVGVVLLPVLLPGSLALAAGVQRLAGGGRTFAVARFIPALAWLSMSAALWCGEILFTAGSRPLFVIPVTCLAVSFVLPLPLWLLSHRPGMTLARAVCHAGGLAWLLACHLPFVSSA